MLLHVDVGNDVVVLMGVFAWPEIPGFFFWIIFPVFKSLKLVVKVDHVVSLLVPERCVSVARENINHVPTLCSFNCLFCLRVVVRLSDRIVQEVLRFDELACNFFIRLRYTLKVALLLNILIHIMFPLFITLRKIVLAGKLSYVCNCRHNIINLNQKMLVL